MRRPWTAEEAGLQTEAGEERLMMSQASEALEKEATERTRLAKEHADLRSRYAALERGAQKLELEAMEYRTLKTKIPASEGSFASLSLSHSLSSPWPLDVRRGVVGRVAPGTRGRQAPARNGQVGGGPENDPNQGPIGAKG